MKKEPLVSVIIPTYNRAHLIGETLDSVLGQTYQNWECIIVDDGSSDNTDEVVGKYVKKDRRFKYYHRPDEHLPGGNGARNYGFRMSRGEYIQWFDSDDLMDESLMKEKIIRLENNLETKFCICKMRCFKIINNKKYIHNETNMNFDNFFKDYVSGKISIGTPSVMWRRNLVIDFKFDESLKHSQDLDFHSRIFSVCNQPDILDKVLIEFRISDKSISDNFVNKLDDYAESYLKVRTRIMKLIPQDLELNKSLTRSNLALLRMALASKKYQLCDKIIDAIFKSNVDKTNIMKIKLLRVKFFYKLFRFIGHGDTRLKRYLRI